MQIFIVYSFKFIENTNFYFFSFGFKEVGPENCFISEITLTELKFGVTKKPGKSEESNALKSFLSGIQILPIFPALEIYAEEKARLQKSGKIIDDFDLLTSATAVSFNLTMVTNNSSHFSRLNDIKLEDWTELS